MKKIEKIYIQSVVIFIFILIYLMVTRVFGIDFISRDVEKKVVALIILSIILINAIKMKLHINKVKEAEIIYDRMDDHQARLEFEPEIYQGPVEQKIQSIDKFFKEEEFNQFAKMIFIKLQRAWTNRNWKEIRPFETNELFEQHKMLMQGYIENKTINVRDKICIIYSKLYRFEQVGDKDILRVVIKVKMKDYIIDENTKQIIQGKKNVEKIRLYELEFLRRTGVKTKPEGEEVNAINCPNCGAPTKVTTLGECEYCGSIITTGEYGWVLNDIEPFKRIKL